MVYKNCKVGVVVPAFNEAKLIRQTLAGIPTYVDTIIVVDDCSQDTTPQIVAQAACEDRRIICIRNEKNCGVGSAIGAGYIWCRDNDMDIAVVMAGDNQMDPADLPSLLDPVAENRTDYCKGNRLITGEAWDRIPRVRYLGNATLSLLTKIASGYWHVADSQTGYTALSKKALHLLPLAEIYPRYGMPNDFLVTLNIYDMRVMDVPVRPVYGEEKSGINIQKIVFTLSFLLLKLFMRRMVRKYIIRDFHPLIFFYAGGVLLLLLDILLVIRFFYFWGIQGAVPEVTALAILFCTISGLQLVLFAMLFDMEANRDLKGK